MTSSFYQTHVHPDNIHLMAVTTPFRLYEWTAMPQGLKNAPPIHQHQMNSALNHLIGKICHIYLDDIIIWSSTIKEHVEHIDLVMKALMAACLFCNKRKCDFFVTEMNFLGHHISGHGIEPNSSKVQRILNWPVPTNPTEVCAFLGLVQYLASFLPQLADHTLYYYSTDNKKCKNKF